MVSFLDRYYSLILALALPAPLWAGATLGSGALTDGIIWSALLLAIWILVNRIPRYQIRGSWIDPARLRTYLYSRILLAVLIIDFGSKALFFRWDRPEPVEWFKNFGLHSVFHPTEFETFHIYLLGYFSYLFVLGPLYFRFDNRTLDRLWIATSAVGLGGTVALVTERLFFDGVHNSFYFAGPLMWLCPVCASPIAISYAWTPADFFWHAIIAPIFLVVVSYFAPASHSVSDSSKAAPARAALLQDGAP
jgi:hypothetical protein